MGNIPFLTGFQERILLKPFLKKSCFVLFHEKIVQKSSKRGKKSNYYTLLRKFLINVIDSKGGQHDLKG